MKLAAFKRYELPILLGLVLVLTLPFIGQAVQHDAHQFIDFAKMELDHPLWQHLQDYNYFGVHYHGADYHDTHPRLQSLYLTMWLLITDGDLSPAALHLEMLLFPLMATVGMYYLARRFRVNAFIATLLLVVSPAFLVNSHLIMIDVPGIALWLVALVFFIKGVDSNRIIYLAAAALFMSLSIFTYYQDLSLLPLAFLYALLYRKLNARSIITLAVPVILFLAFVAAHYAYYSDPPNFTYTFGQPMGLYSIIDRIRGTVVLLGGALLFPLAMLAIFSRIRWINKAGFGVLVISVIWSAIYYFYGAFASDVFLLMPWMMAIGAMVLLFITRIFVKSAPSAIAGTGGRDNVVLCVWFMGIFFYNCILLPYPSTRYLIPLIPPLAIFASREIVRLWGSELRRLVIATALIAGSTVALTVGIAVAENLRANNNLTEVEWVTENYPPNGHVWYNGGLGFQYYIDQKGYPMAFRDGDGIQVGDYIVESVNNRWYFDRDFLFRLKLVGQKDFSTSWPIATEFHVQGTSWLGVIGMNIPYGFNGDYLDRLYIYQVVWSPEDEIACRADPPTE